MSLSKEILQILYEEERRLFTYCYKEHISEEELNGEDDEFVSDEVIYLRGCFREVGIIRRKVQKIIYERKRKITRK